MIIKKRSDITFLKKEKNQVIELKTSVDLYY